MRVALTAWEGRISPVFDTARQVLLAEVVDGGLVGRTEETLEDGPLELRVRRLVALGADALVCGAISRPLAALVRAAGIRLVPFVAGPVDDVLCAYVHGTLPAEGFQMPGCCGGRRRTRNRRGRGCP